MNCKAVQGYMSAYIDRELRGPEMAEIRAHLSECWVCAREEEDLRRLKGILSSMSVVEPPEGLEGRILASVGKERRANLKITGLTWVAGLSLAVGILAGSLLRPEPSHETVATPPTATPRSQAIPFEIDRDQAFAASNDPLGGHVVLATDTYGQP